MLMEKTGKTKLAILYASPRRENATRRSKLVLDPDGPTHNAMRINHRPQAGRTVDLSHMNQWKLVVKVTGKDSPAKLDHSLQAVLGGDVDGPLAQFLYQWHPPPYDGWLLSAFVSSDLLVTATLDFGRAAADGLTMEMKEI
jgi:hypothetical protein